MTNMKVAIISIIIATMAFIVLDKINNHRKRSDALENGIPLTVTVIDKGATSRRTGTKKRSTQYILVTHSNSAEERIYLKKKHYSKIKRGDLLPAVIKDGKVYLKEYPRK